MKTHNLIMPAPNYVKWNHNVLNKFQVGAHTVIMNEQVGAIDSRKSLINEENKGRKSTLKMGNV
jgi:hypothetical protein